MGSEVDFREGPKMSRLRGVRSISFWLCLGFLAATSAVAVAAVVPSATSRPIGSAAARDRGHQCPDDPATAPTCLLSTWGVPKNHKPISSGAASKSSPFAGTTNVGRYAGRGVTDWTAARKIGIDAGDEARPRRTSGMMDPFDARNAAHGHADDEVCTEALTATCRGAILRIRCGGDSSYGGSGAGSGYAGYGYDDDRERGGGGGGGNHHGGRDHNYDGYEDDRYYSEATSGSRRRRRDDDYVPDDDYYGESSRRRNDYYGRNDEDDDYYRSSSAPQPRRRVGSGNNIPALSSSLLTRGNKKIGTAFAGAGALLTLLGISMFFHKTLLRMGNICFMIGVPLFIGPGRTAGYFLQPKKARATACLLLGMFLVLVGRPILGIALETFGILNLFGNMFPVFLALARNLPIVGDLLGSGGGNKKKEKRGQQQQWKQEEDSGYYEDGGLPRRGDEDDVERYY